MALFLPRHRVVLLLLAGLIAALSGLGFINFAANRLVSGESYMLWALAHAQMGWLWAPVAGVLFSVFMPGRLAAWLALIAGEATLIALLLLLIHQTSVLSAGASPLARVSPGAGLWLAACLCLLICNDASRRITTQVVGRWLLQAQIWIFPLYLLASGAFDGLSLLKEYANRQQVFNDALWGHLVLLLATVIPALAISFPLGLWCARHRRGQSSVFTVLNIIQTIPSIALFGLLMAPLAGLAASFPWLAAWGISGIGMAPALIALVLYALLPLVRAVAVGLEQVPASVLESARGMGMNAWQIAWQVEMPLALPLLLSGLKVVAVQTVGMAVIAALIGAGGLGTLIFQGVLSSALDLVLLGVIPVIALAVLVDALFTLAIVALETKYD